jgi:tetratricopeptide (TPR) repeat protein
MFGFSRNKTIIFRKRFDPWVFLFLMVAVLSVYSGVINFDFIIFDDTQYVTGNGQVKSGLTRQGITWSLLSTHSANWHPLTWLSHMADVEFYGLNAGGHHLTNVLLHIANTLLLFILLRRMTNTLWCSAIVAALFAVHPLHVESVVWVAERKDLLSTFFGMLALIGYVRYTRQRSRSAYGLGLLCFMLALMAKPMWVTLPFLLLLLDYWPLGRIKFNSGFRLQSSDQTSPVFSLLFEKIPFFILTAASCVVTFYAQQSGGAVTTLDMFPLGSRIANAVVSYVGYMGKMFWPVQLTVFYPYPDSFALWKVAAAAAVLVTIFIWVTVQIRKRPYLAVGWFWYVGTLVPVIGLVQVGSQTMADRYTYVPLIGLFVMIAWGGTELVGRWRLKHIAVAIATGVVLTALTIAAHNQTSYWTNSITVFEHAIEVTENNWVAHHNLGKALNDIGRDTEAFQHYSDALRIKPNSAHIHVNFGSALLAQGKINEAVDHFNYALKLDPDFAEAYNNLGLAHVRRGQIEDAVYFFRVAHQKNPSHANAQHNLNLAISINEKINRAVRRMHQSLNIDLAELGLDLKIVELSERKRDLMETVKNFQKAMTRQPGFMRIEENNISAVSSVMKEYESLLPLFLKTIKIQPASADTSYHIACLYSRKGMVEESNKWLSKALGDDPARREFFLADPDLENMNQ